MVNRTSVISRIAAGAVVVVLEASAVVSAVAAEHVHSDRPSGARDVLGVDVYATGDTVDLLTAESTGANGAPTLWYRRSGDGGRSWSNPVRVDAGMPTAHEPHRSNDPQIASDGQRVIAVWASAGRGFRSSGAMVTALSNDGGRTWRRGPNPSDDERNDGHGFADIIASKGRFHLTWLDSRSGSQGVRYARSADGGATWSRNASVKTGSCECCWNTLLSAQDRALYLLFRGKGPRDMGLASSADNGATWKPLGRVGAYNWQIEACPHTGGALGWTAQGASQQLHALVWTGKTEQRGVHYLSSRDGGASWIRDIRLGGESAQRADLAVRGHELIAVWDEFVGEHGAVLLSRSEDAGAEWTKPMRLSSETASAIYPRIVATPSSLLALWTEASGGESRLRIVLLK
jgi:hypothetical protein